MNCVHCGGQVSGRRDRLYCSPNCRKRASEKRRKTGAAPPQRWRHPALRSEDVTLQSAAAHATLIAEANGWTPTMLLQVLDGLTAALRDRPPGQPVPLTVVRARTARQGYSIRVAQVLAAADLLGDDSPTIYSWIERRTAQLPSCFASDVRAWLLTLLEGDARSRPRSRSTLYVYLGAVEPLLQHWGTTHGHLREITTSDINTALDPLRGWTRSNAITALRSLFRFAAKRRLIFTNPTARLTNPGGERHLVPLTDSQIDTIQRLSVTPAQRLVVALAAVHAASVDTIRHLTLDHVDLPNRRIILDGVAQPLGSMTHRALRVWLDYRRGTWPSSPNQHLVISRGNARGTAPAARSYLNGRLLPPGVLLHRIRGDRVLHEALTTGADPLHLSLVFNLSHTTASRYAAFAQDLLDHELEQDGQ